MTIADKHITHYNNLNGKAVTRKDLVEFHKRLKHDIKIIDTTTAAGAECIAIEKRLSSGLKKMKSRKMKIKCKVVDIANVRKANGQSNDLSKEFIYGLENGLPKGEKPGLGFTKEGQQKIYDMINGMILKSMEENKDLPWQTPWAVKTIPATNFKTKTVYQGANYFLLNLFAPILYGKNGPYWLTFKQVTELGGQVRKDAKGFPVIFYTVYYVVTKPKRKTITEQEYKALSDKEKVDQGAMELFTINYYRVFAQEDIKGIDFPKLTEKKKESSPIETAERIVENMPKRPEIIHHTAGEAYYVPSRDIVKVPDLEYFKTDQEYYSTLFHELIHSTGHESRVGRAFGKQKTKEYAFEELIGELGASYLNAQAGILFYTLKNSAAYLKHWKSQLEQVMKEDNKFFLKAAAQAAKAADFILDQPILVEKRLNGIRKKRKAVRKKITERQAKKVAKVMREFKHKKLTSHGRTVRKKKQAVAIAMKEAKIPKRQKLAGVINSAEYVKNRGKISSLDLGPFKDDFTRMNSDTNVMIWGQPGHGKTVAVLKLAQHFAEKGKRVLYVAEEEYGKSTLDEKVDEFKIGHKNLDFVGELDESLLSHYDIIFFDSVNSIGLNSHDVKRLDKQFPNKVFILIVQTTKAGDFRGGRDWEHIVDIAGEIRNRQLILRKNRLDPDFKHKADKLLLDDMISERKQREIVRASVKRQLQPAQEDAKVVVNI